MDLNVGLVVEAVAGAVPDRDAVVWHGHGRRLTYAQFLDRCRRLAGALRAHGLGVHGDPAAVEPWAAAQDLVLLHMTNCPEYLEGMVGGYLGRIGPANVNYRYTASELRYLRDDSGARAAICHRRFAHLWGDDLDLLLVVDDGSDAPLPARAVPYEQALAAESTADLPEPSPDDLYVVYTGGTTGMPKGVLWRQADFLAGAIGVRATYDELAAAAPRSVLRTLPAPPLMHGAAHWNAVSALAAGGTIVLQSTPERFDVDDVLDTVEAERCTSLNIVGDAFGIPLADAVEAQPQRDLSSLRHIVTGGAVLSAATKDRLTTLLPGVRIVDIVGSSESGRQGVSDSKTAAGRFRRAGSATVLAEDRSRNLATDDHTVGWLATTGPIPRGYLGDAAKTAATFPVVDGTRYVVAGDRARWADDGSIELLGRESATINTGGEKVFAEEVEAALRAHPAVADAAVAGRPSERWGEEVVAVVALRSGHEAVTDDELRDACATTLARYKLPRAFVRVEAVQRTASGKTDHAWGAFDGRGMSRLVAVDDRFDLQATLSPFRLGRGDRTVRFDADGSVWRATRTPDGTGTAHYRPVAGTTAVAVDAWGDGASWLVEHAPDLLGCDDAVDGFDAVAQRHPVVRRVARDRPGLRIARSHAVYEALLPAVLSQKVTGLEAKRAWRGLVGRWGEVAPGPVRTLRVPPAPEVLARLPYHALHPLGVERKRAETLQAVARHPRRLDEAASLPVAEARGRLCSIRGVGAWTAAEVARMALGDADAVSVGDYHLPHVVCFALAGERVGDDVRMLELLAPFAPYRGRVCRLLESAGLGPPRRGPRRAPYSFNATALGVTFIFGS